MFDIDKWKEIWKTITSNKTRSVLTAFGVFWGILMFILLVGFGNGFSKAVLGLFDGIASNSAFFYANRTSEPYKGFQKGRRWKMNDHDLNMILQKSRMVEYISPMLFSGGGRAGLELRTVRGNKTGSYAGIGVLPDYYQINKVNLVCGRLINEIDIIQSRKVCAIGKEVYETLFEIGEDPLGQYIRFNGIYYQVIGVIVPVSENISIGSYPPQTVYIPYTTARHTSGNEDYFDLLAVTVKPGYEVTMLEAEIKEILKENHQISPADETAAMSINVEKEFAMFNNLFSSVSILVWIVGMGALLSGIIGISNIMLVTVRERMREIGVRRALGAKPVTIIVQIMSESFVLTAIAGLGGFLFGTLILLGLDYVMTSGPKEGFVFSPLISFNVALYAMGILVLSGMLAGIMPALRALQIKAIDALRDE